MRIHDAVFGVILILAGIAIALHARTFPDMPGQRFGPALVPTIIAAGFAICGVVLVVGGLRSRAVHGLVELGEWARKGGHIFDVVLVVGGLVLLIVSWNVVGFLIGATVYSTALAARFRGGRIVSSFVVCALACLAIDWGFRHLLLVPLPLGPLTTVYW